MHTGQDRHIESVSRTGKVEAQNCHQDEGAARQEHDRQLHGGVLLALLLRAAPPDADQQVHREDRDLVEEEEQEEIARREDAEDAAYE